MTSPSFRFSPTLRILAGGIALTLATVAFGIHPQNAGPDTFEIKFKLPPPKPLTAEEELKTFKLQPGFHAELVASDPMVEAPVALSWDDKGRLFVCEMRGYMKDVDGTGENEPVGRISILEDTNGDGKMDKKTIFADELVAPRAVMCVNGGALVGEPPNLWFMKDTNGDGKADVKEPVDTHFGSQTGQPEHMVNSPTWAMDNWIYLANHSSRYRLKDGKFLTESMPQRGQWGMTQDDFGRLYYNFNSDFLRATFVPEHLYQRNPNFPGAAGAGVQIMKLQTVWPGHPTPGVNRGYEAKQLRDDGSLMACTATCGAGIFRSPLFGKEYQGNAFIPEPAGNLVKRLRIEDKQGELTASNAYEGKEFMTSTDERFRPCNAYTGPDGALYIVDMYRGVVQHKGFLTHYLVQNIKDRELEKPFTGGRIWRIVPDNVKPVMAKIPADTAGLVAALGHQNGWVRDTAQRLLVEKKDAAALPLLAQALKTGSPITKAHALWAIEGIGLPAPEAVVAALKDPDAKVRAAAVRVADRTLVPQLSQMISDPSVEVQTALAFTLSPLPEAQNAVITLATTAGQEPRVRDGILSGLRGRELEILTAMLTPKTGSPSAMAKAAPEAVVSALAQAVMAEKRSSRVKQLVALIGAQKPNSPEQVALLSGASGKTSAKAPAKGKLLYLDSEATELTTLKAKADDKVKPLLAALDARLAWPSKPGVPPPPVVKPLTPEEMSLFETGKTVYNTLCGACHQPTGVGMPGLAPALVDSEWVLGNDKVLPRIVLHGLSGPIKVGGQAWSLEMPPLGAALSDEQIAGVLTYIRREWEHTASPVSPKMVAEIRASHQSRTTAWSSEELVALTKPGGKSMANGPEEAAPTENVTGDAAAEAALKGN